MKKGFTLAELLVTLGIIGVVAAMTLPSFINKAADAKIGPSLAKAVSSFDQANKALLADKEVEAVSEIITLELGQDIFSYWDMLSDYMIISNERDYSTLEVNTEEGFSFKILPNASTVSLVASSLPHLQELTDCVIDINGKDLPNDVGTDQFYFKLMNDGSLQPYGANGIWKQYCPVGEVPTDPKYCSGHIFENGFKILYE